MQLKHWARGWYNINILVRNIRMPTILREAHSCGVITCLPICHHHFAPEMEAEVWCWNFCQVLRRPSLNFVVFKKSPPFIHLAAPHIKHIKCIVLFFSCLPDFSFMHLGIWDLAFWKQWVQWNNKSSPLPYKPPRFAKIPFSFEFSLLCGWIRWSHSPKYQKLQNDGILK